MTKWQKEPPTYEQWKGANNNGVWWIKFIIMDGHTEVVDGEDMTWPEAWYTDVVSISMSSTNGLKHIMQKARGETPDYSGIRLHASGSHGIAFDLDDATRTKDTYWQPVAAPIDDIKDERPKV